MKEEHDANHIVQYAAIFYVLFRRAFRCTVYQGIIYFAKQIGIAAEDLLRAFEAHTRYAH
ncbi:hypothetical protein NRI_0801 [Neorickettsia risticii str. Illinois]|uniref:Uncharacterized protein n=1 Tax=Neorickettsia risticii (strain Illinois) TaxID=434131 RepID=C6V5V4_NEORI|nr:hypothetical protein NRI_0801 [Neorickettsia risticii str. Illinois]